MGHFTEEALRKFNAMCAEGLEFSEGPVYDFARCIKSDGEIYGVSPGEACEEGRPIPDKKAKDSSGDIDSKLARLKIAFRKKTGRELTPEELKKAKDLLTKLKGGVLQQLLPKK